MLVDTDVLIWHLRGYFSRMRRPVADYFGFYF